jgi:photosystem II stability/assembly factor-like uncharacterized protein
MMKIVMIAVLVVLAATAFADWTSIGPEGGPTYCGTVTQTNPPTVYVASTSNGTPLFKMTDGGATWVPTAGVLGNYPYVLVSHPTDPNQMYGVISSIFYRTTNAGTDWSQSSLGSNTYGNDIALNPLNPQVIYVPCYAYDGTAWRMTSAKSTDGGSTWVNTQLDTTSSTTLYSAAVDPVDTNVVYMGAYFGTSTVVFKSTDCGATWAQCVLPGNLYYIYSLYISPTDHNTVFAGTLYGIYRSTDAGETWNQQCANNYNYRIVSVPDEPEVMYSAAYTGIYRSTDAGVTWTTCGTGIQGTNIRLVLTVPGEDGTVYCGSTGGMFKSTDYGATWNEINHGILIGNIPVVAFDPGAPGTAYAEFIDNAIFKTTDDGVAWERQPTILSCGNVCSILIDPADPQRRWMFEGSG